MNTTLILNLRAQEKTIGCGQRATKRINCSLILGFLKQEAYRRQVEWIDTRYVVQFMNQTTANVLRYLHILENERLIKKIDTTTDEGGYATYSWACR
jgi:predicted transcriptional regulator